MSRQPYTFFAGVFAGLAWTHAAYAVATSADIVDEPVFMGRRWGIGYMWSEAVLYSAISLALGYAGRKAKTEEHEHGSTNAVSNGQGTRLVVPSGQPAST